MQGQVYYSRQSQDSPGALDSPPHRSPLFERALLSEPIIRGSVGVCPFAWSRFAMRQTSSFSNCSRSRVLCFWHRRYRDRIVRQRSGHFSAKCETDKLS